MGLRFLFLNKDLNSNCNEFVLKCLFNRISCCTYKWDCSPTYPFSDRLNSSWNKFTPRPAQSFIQLRNSLWDVRSGHRCSCRVDLIVLLKQDREVNLIELYGARRVDCVYSFHYSRTSLIATAWRGTDTHRPRTAILRYLDSTSTVRCKWRDDEPIASAELMERSRSTIRSRHSSARRT